MYRTQPDGGPGQRVAMGLGVDVFVGVKDTTGFGTYSWAPGLNALISKQLPAIRASGVVL